MSHVVTSSAEELAQTSTQEKKQYCPAEEAGMYGATTAGY